MPSQKMNAASAIRPIAIPETTRLWRSDTDITSNTLMYAPRFTYYNIIYPKENGPSLAWRGDPFRLVRDFPTSRRVCRASLCVQASYSRQNHHDLDRGGCPLGIIRTIHQPRCADNAIRSLGTSRGNMNQRMVQGRVQRMGRGLYRSRIPVQHSRDIPRTDQRSSSRHHGDALVRRSKSRGHA